VNRRIRRALEESFGLKLLVAFAAVIVVSLSIYTVLGAVREGDKVKKGLTEQGELFARLLAHGSVVGIFAENTTLLKEAAAGILGQKDVASVAMYNADGNVLYSGGGTASGKRPPPFLERSTDRAGVAAPLEVVETADAFEFTMPVSSRSLPGTDESLYLGGAGTGGAGRVIGFVRIVLSKDSYQKEILSLVARNVVMMLVFIVASGVIVWFAVKKILRPLETLTENVKALGKGLSVGPMPVHTRDEVGKLATAFNAMVVARRQAEESLRESEDRYRRLVELSPDAIYVQQEGRIAFINAAGARLMGAPDPAELREQLGLEFIHEEDRGNAEKMFLQVEEEGVTVPLLQLRYVRPDWTTVDVEAAVAPFTFKGRRSALVIARDVTERKGMQERILLYQKELYTVASEMSSLESRVEERERHLIAADLHDYVGQNLVVLNFKLGAFRKALSDPDAARHVDELRDLILRTIEYTRSLTVELSPPILVELGLTDAIESLAEAFEKAHGIRVCVEDDGVAKETDGDTRYLLFRCVRELLMNAVKHSRSDSVRISLEAQRANVQIVVADNGVGFDADRVAGKKGGFGLFSIRERLKRVGGSCEISSGQGEGTRVVLTAPIRK
jgi:PAS domain S-box-containing protein